MARLVCRSDAASAVIEPRLLCVLSGQPRADDRHVNGGILHVLKVSCRRRRDVPPA